MRVKIIKSSSSVSWYAESIGKIFNVKEPIIAWPGVSNEMAYETFMGGYVIKICDCVLLNRKSKLERILKN